MKSNLEKKMDKFIKKHKIKDLNEFLDKFPKNNKQFGPKPFYSKDGNAVYYYFKNEESFAEQIDNNLTVFKSIINNKIIGIALYNIKGVAEKLTKSTKTK